MSDRERRIRAEWVLIQGAGRDLEKVAEALELDRGDLEAQLEPLKLSVENGCLEYKLLLVNSIFRQLENERYKSLPAATRSPPTARSVARKSRPSDARRAERSQYSAEWKARRSLSRARSDRTSTCRRGLESRKRRPRMSGIGLAANPTRTHAGKVHMGPHPRQGPRGGTA